MISVKADVKVFGVVESDPPSKGGGGGGQICNNKQFDKLKTCRHVKKRLINVAFIKAHYDFE